MHELKSKKYNEVIKLGDKLSGSVFVETVYPLVTTLKHYNGLFWYFENYGMLAGFLVYGKMTLVKRVIVEIKGNYCGKYIPICHVEEAIIVSINENKHERAIGLLQALLPKKTASPSSDSLPFEGRNSKKSIQVFSILFAKY